MSEPIESMPGIPVILKDDRVLCYSCFNNDDTAELDRWYSDDAENYPVDCDGCGVSLTGPSHLTDAQPS